MQRVMPDPTESPISIRGLSKRYGKLTAVKNLDLEVNQAEILGFLGLNGAGKTTTIRVLLDLLRPTSGKASILGHDCQQDGLQARVVQGVCGNDPVLGGLDRESQKLRELRSLHPADQLIQ